MLRILNDFASPVSSEAALLRRNVRSRRGRFVDGCQDYFVLHDILPAEEFALMRKLAVENKSLFLRKHSSVQTRNPILKAYQAWVNWIFYGDPRQ